MKEVYGSDLFSPQDVAEKVDRIGVAKAHFSIPKTLVLSMLAGGFIGLGAIFCLLVISVADLSFAIQRGLGGLVFSSGLILVVFAGAELSTGNNLLVMAWVSGKISGFRLLGNLCLVYFANAFGAAGLAIWSLGDEQWTGRRHRKLCSSK